MSQMTTKWIANNAVTATKLGSGSALSSQAAFADGSGNVTYRSILSTDVPTLNQNTTGTAANITAISNSTLTTLSALTSASALATVGTITTGVWNGTAIAIANGGTGQTSAAAAFVALSPLTTAGDIIYENATPAPARLAIGSTGQVLTVVSGLPAWVTPSTSEALTQNHIFVGNASNVATDVAMSGEASIVASGAVTLSNAAVIAKVLTGYSSGAGTVSSSDSILSAIQKIDGNEKLDLDLAGTRAMTGALNMNSHQINNVSNGTSSDDAINLGQLQAAIAGLTWKGPAQAYAASNVPLTGGATLTIDGYSVQNGDLVILGNQTTASQNGEYLASGVGSAYLLTANSLPNAVGDAWLIQNGTVYEDSAFVANAAVPAATFTEFAGPTAYTFTAPLLLTGRTVSITQASGSANGYLSSVDWNTFNNKQAAGNYITALTGDATASGPGSTALTLATVNSNVGSFGGASSVPSFTVNAKGLVTAASATAVVAPAGTLSGTTLNATVVSSSLTSLGTITTGVWNGTTIAIANGGTGQTSAAAAFAALSPLTTAGDIIIENATPAPARLAIGSTGQVLTVVSGLPAWSSPAASPGDAKDTFILASRDITNQFVTLTNTPIANSVSFLVQGGGAQLEGSSYDYVISGAQVQFKNGLATGGVSALIAGDILQIAYQH